MEVFFDSLQNIFVTYGLWFVFPLLILENFPFIGFFTPAMTTLFLAGFLFAENLKQLLLVFIVAYSGLIVGDNIWFFIGDISGGRWRWLKKIKKSSPNVEAVLKEQSVWVLIFYQFVPYLRMFLPFALGVYGYSKWRWLFLNLVGSFIYALLLVSAGFVTAKAIFGQDGLAQIMQNANYVIVALTLAYTLFVIKQYLKKRYQTEKDEDKNCETKF